MPERSGLSAVHTADWLADLVAGGLDPEALSPLAGRPVVAVEVSGARGGVGGLPTSLPCVLVGVAEADAVAEAAGDTAGFDVLLTDAAHPPAPWVGCQDLGPVLDGLVEAVERSPLASAGLVQLLRMTGGLAVEEGLVGESLLYSALQAGPGFARWLAGHRAPRRRLEAGRPLLAERRGDVVMVELNRPEVRNAFNQPLRDALVEVLRLAVADPSVTSVEVRGSGPCFSSGGDLGEFGTAPDPVTAHVARTTRSPASWLARCTTTTFFVHGPCRGAGVELAAFGRRVLAEPGTSFALPEVAMGLVPGAGGTVSIPRRIGRQRFAYLALSGAVIEAPLALEWGLVDEVAPRPRAGGAL